MTGASVCSGIIAPEVAMPWVDWKWCAEIEPFPCEVIRQRHGKPNLGDITAPDFVDRAMGHGPVDLLVGGTPCQAFSVAGRGLSLADDRGKLTLRFVEIVDAIDPRYVLWENVPGVFPKKDNPFGCFLAALVGADEAIVPIDGWRNAGVVSGPRRTAAWRVLDAQFFGVAQRRRRVFVLAVRGSRNWACAEALLPLAEGLCRDTPPRRKAGQGVTRGVANGVGGGSDVAMCLNAKGGMGRIDGESETLIAQGGTHGVSAVEDGVPSIKVGSGLDIPSCPAVAIPQECPECDGYGYVVRGGTEDECSLCGASVRMAAEHERRPVGLTYCNACEEQYEQLADFRPSPRQELDGFMLLNNPCPKCGGNSSGQLTYYREFGGTVEAVAVNFRGRDGGTQAELGDDVATSLRCAGGTSSKAHALVNMAVRRLTPRECERLQGFPDDWTAITYRGKPAADGPRYKALGNSMATTVVKWIGDRIRKIHEGSNESAKS